jgi:hypothetical protein
VVASILNKPDYRKRPEKMQIKTALDRFSPFPYVSRLTTVDGGATNTFRPANSAAYKTIFAIH